MAVNKVVYNTGNGEQILIDLTNDTVTSETLLNGVTAHDKTGNTIIGTAMIGETVDLDSEIESQDINILEQDNIIAQIIAALEGKAIGGGNIDSGNYPLGQKMYTFAAMSDIHVTEDNYNNGVDDFARAIPHIQAKGAEFVCISGDIGRYSREAELQIFTNLLDTYATIPFYSCTGNHDMMYTEAMWKQYMGFDRNFVFTHKGDVFIFASLDIQSANTTTSANPYAITLPWLKQQLQIYAGARIFLFMHHPPSTYSGLMPGQYYGYSSDSTQDDELITAINSIGNVTLFHGHTHYKFQTEALYDHMNVYRFNASRTALVHTPSCSHPRNENMVVETDLSQAYIVDVYEQGFVLRGIDLVTGEYMTDYEYILPYDNNSDTIKNAIIVDATDTSLVAGESVTVKVKMSMDAANVAIAANNDAITVSPTTLVFTADNYATEQEITITAASDFGTNVSSMITLSSEGLTSKTVSFTLVDSDYNGEEIITIPWVEGYYINSNATEADESDSNYMSTQEFIAIEDGYEYTVHSRSAGSYPLYVLYYSDADTSTFISRSDDVGSTIFPNGESYTLQPPTSAKYFRLRSKTLGDHQTWKDNIVLTKDIVEDTPDIPDEPDEPGTQISEVISIPWVEGYYINSNATEADESNGSYMSTQEFIAIEDGYTYELSVNTLGSYPLYVLFYSGNSYTNFIERTEDIGTNLFPTTSIYTIVPPSNATHFRLRCKTSGQHQTWKDNIVLTKIKNT